MRTSWPPALQAAVLCFAFAISASAAMLWAQPAGHIAAVWPANAFLAAAFILMSGRWRWICALACFLPGVVAAIVLATPVGQAIVYCGLNIAEAGLTAWLALRFCGVRARRLSLIRLLRLQLIAVLPATAIVSLAAAAMSPLLLHIPFAVVWRDWFVADALGMAVVLPTLLLAVRASYAQEFRRSTTEVAALLIGLALVTGAVMAQSSLPLLFAVFPAMTLVALRLGPAGAAVGGVLVGLIAITLTVTGQGPAELAMGLDISGRMHLTQAFVAAVAFTGVATGGAFADQERLRRMLLARDRVLRRTRLRVQEAAAEI